MRTTLLINESYDPFNSYDSYSFTLFTDENNPTPTGRWYIKNDYLYLEITFTKTIGWFKKRTVQLTKFINEKGINLSIQGDIQTCSNKLLIL